MAPFEFVEPDTLDEAFAALDADDPTVRPFAGGTALMLMLKSGAFTPTRLVSLEKLATFRGITVEDDGSIVIGAMTSMSTVEHSALIGERVPVIPRAMKRLANVRVRNVACIGGALAHGDPHMDLPPLFASLGAEVIAVGRDGERTIPVQDLYLGYYETVLADELIRAVRIPPQAGRAMAYLKCTTRSADDWPALGVAINGHRSDGGNDGPPSDVRIVLGAVMDRPTRMTAAEDVLAAGPLDAARIADACEAAGEAVEPESDVRGSAAYKRQLVRVYVGRAIRAAFANGASA